MKKGNDALPSPTETKGRLFRIPQPIQEKRDEEALRCWQMLCHAGDRSEKLLAAGVRC